MHKKRENSLFNSPYLRKADDTRTQQTGKNDRRTNKKKGGGGGIFDA